MSLSPSLLELTDGSVAAEVAIVTPTGVQLSGFDPSKGSAAALTQLAYAAGSLVALPANANRRKARIFNPTNKTVYLAYGATCSLTVFTDLIPSNTSFETDLNEYTGVISVIWSGAPSAGPELQITEIS